MTAQPGLCCSSRGGGVGTHNVLRMLCAAVATIALVPLSAATAAAAERGAADARMHARVAAAGGDAPGAARAHTGEPAPNFGGRSAPGAELGRGLLHLGCHQPSCAPVTFP